LIATLLVRWRTLHPSVAGLAPGPQPTGGVFRVWFYTIMTPPQTMIMSQITKLFFFGMPGFRGKMWLVNDTTGEFGGIYQFDTVEQARDYVHSFAIALSKRRSRPGMFRYYAKDGESSLYRAQEHPMQVGQSAGI
jgi:hypothetical protein